MITHQELLSLVTYNPETGRFYALENRGKWVAGEPVGTIRATGYRQLCVSGHIYLEHRLAWFYVHGVWPKAGIDHRNRQRGDNRIDNLREATQTQNHENRSGVVGYTRSAAKSTRWTAKIIVDGVRHYLGTYATEAEANAAYLAAKKVLHKFNPTGNGEVN